MNILLTGGAGYIGSHTTLSLIDKGHSVTVIDNLSTGSKALIPKKAKHFDFDIADETSTQKILKENKFDIAMLNYTNTFRDYFLLYFFWKLFPH